ncbi:MAG: hypothetical protein IJ379_11945 [Lachnospiraceae bacterium]|nr:hypothetical protein [Lachnospiraceae bacterium]
MINERLSSVSMVQKSYNSVIERSSADISDLRKYYEEVNANNAWAQKTSTIKLIFNIIFCTAAVVALFMWETVCDLLQEKLTELINQVYPVTGDVFDPNSFFILKVLVLIILVHNIYATVRTIFCLKVFKFYRKINKVELHAGEAIGTYRGSNALKMVKDAIANNQTIQFPTENKLGNEMAEIREQLKTLNASISTYKKIAEIITSIALIAIVAYGMLGGWKPALESGIPMTFGTAGMIMMIIAIEVIIVIMMKVGPYTGKFTKLIGLILAAGYGYMYHVILQDRTTAILERELMQQLNVGDNSIFTMAVAFPALTVISMIFIIFFTNLSGEVDKLKNGFVVEMAYGDDKTGGKKWVLFLGGWYILNMLVLANFMGSIQELGFVALILPGFLWWVINPLMRPRGSRLYAFFGRGRCVANEIALFLACIMMIVSEQGPITMLQLSIMGGMIVGSLIVGGIARYINNNLVI